MRDSSSSEGMPSGPGACWCLNGHTYLEEFVEVVGDDAQIAQAFEQRNAGVARWRQYAEIEFEGRQLRAQK